MTQKQKWFHGLVGGIVGGFAGAIDSGLTLPLLAPDKFNINAGLGKLLLGMLVFAILSGVKVGAAYLRQSPVPPDDDAGPPSSPITGTTHLVFLGALMAFWLAGCAQLQPGANPLVVRVEQTAEAAQSTFQLALKLDNADRGFWRTNAPAFHNYCEWLRVPTVYQETNTLPRYRVLLLSLDDVKQDYKTGWATSNMLHTALVTFKSVTDQTSYWLGVITNTPPKLP